MKYEEMKKILEFIETKKNHFFIKENDKKQELILIKNDIVINKSKNTININNELINAAQNLSLSEKRILMMAVAQSIKINKKINKNECLEVKIKASEFSKLFKVKINTAYEQIKEATDTMITKQIEWYREKGIRKIKTNWIADAEYEPGKGNIKILFTPKIQAYLLELKKNFSSYNLKKLSVIKSIHSWRLFELLNQFNDTGWRKITIEHFSIVMEATEKQKKDFSKIRKQIIEPAIKELYKKNLLKIEWKSIKDGKKVQNLYFKFKKINNKSTLKKIDII